MRPVSTLAYRNPTEIERSFLRVVTRGYRHLSSQIENCRIADYDVVGFCYVEVLAGPPATEFASQAMIPGPILELSQIELRPVEIVPVSFMPDPQVLAVEILLLTDRNDLLTTIEVVSYGDSYVVDPYRLFVDAAETTPSPLRYRSEPARKTPHPRGEDRSGG